jgi:indoleamine 2,3-dioxygenase
MTMLSYIGHAYVWGVREPAHTLPAVLAVPWYRVAQRLGRPPVLSYASYALHNWRRIYLEGPVTLGNIALLQNFLGGLDEEWFILVHVDIESRAAPAIRALLPAQAAAGAHDLPALQRHLATIRDALAAMNATMDRMPEGCDPYIYYTRVRPYIFGWKDNPGLPNGLLYAGVAEYGGLPQKFRGETGAQSSIVPALDAALGISHADDPLRTYLNEMRDYMPPAHHAFIEQVEGQSSVRACVAQHRLSHAALRDLYNDCVTLLQRFRSRHLEYAAAYIHKQAQKANTNSNEVGTGGTPFMTYLSKHRDETSTHLL